MNDLVREKESKQSLLRKQKDYGGMFNQAIDTPQGDDRKSEILHQLDKTIEAYDYEAEKTKEIRRKMIELTQNLVIHLN